MKRIVLISFFFGLAALVNFESCQSAKSSTATKMLKFNLEKGKGYDYEATVNMDQQIMGQSIQMDMTTYYSMFVEAVDGDTKTITTSIDRFKLKTGAGGFNIDIDTDDPIAPSTDTSGIKGAMDKMNKVFGAIKGRKFTMKVNAEGEVMSVTGFENMAESLADSLDLPAEERTKMMDQFSKQFNGDQVKGQMERFLYIFPNKEVKVGDSWQKNAELMGTMPGKYNSTYKVTEIEGDMITLDEKTNVASSEEKVNLTGTINGTIVVDSRSGLVVNADQDMNLQASASGMKFDIKGKTKIKGVAR